MSEKPSDISTLPPDDVPGLLLDENLSSPDIAQLLRKFPKEWRIEIHTDCLARGLPDVQVIEQCAERGLVLVSCDDRIRYVPQNKAAVLRNRIGVFMFNKGNYQGVEYAAAMIVGRGQILNVIRRTAPPFFARVRRSGEIELLEPKPSASGKELTSKERTARKYGERMVE